MKNRIFFGLVMLLILSNKSLFAQTNHIDITAETSLIDPSVKSTYESETIYVNGALNRYTKNKEERRIGFFVKKLKSEFSSSSEESKRELMVCEKKKKKGTLLLAVGGTAIIGSLIVLPIAAPVALGAFIAGMIPYTAGGIEMNASKDHLQKAVWLHNRDVVAKNEKRSDK
ncbi:MAG: hypothetical protein JNL60_02865 [Bacteroidia bacterium]|nr:hypothetical protein [Bacteroidia bacterium]